MQLSQSQIPTHLQVVEPKIGDHVIYKGHLFWLVLHINMPDTSIKFALRQAHWPEGHVLLADKKDVCTDVPLTA